jgi:hypothetical protein
MRFYEALHLMRHKEVQPEPSRSRVPRRFSPGAESLENHVCLSQLSGGLPPSISSLPAEIKAPVFSNAAPQRLELRSAAIEPLDSTSGGIKDQQNIQLHPIVVVQSPLSNPVDGLRSSTVTALSPPNRIS